MRDSQRRHAAVRSRIDHRQVQGRCRSRRDHRRRPRRWRATLADRSSWADFDIVDIPTDADPEAAAAAMRARPDVEYAQPRYRNHAMARPNDTLYAQSVELPRHRHGARVGHPARRVVRHRRRRARQRHGVSIGHVALQLALLVPADAERAGLSGARRRSMCRLPRRRSWAPADRRGSCRRAISSGTTICRSISTATARTSPARSDSSPTTAVGAAGMAYNVRLMPVKVIQGLWDEIFGSPFDGTDDVVARGVRYAADNGAKVINLSIGREDGGPATAVTDAIRYAVGRGCFVVVASGNTRADGNQPNRLAQPAPDIAGMVAVGAVGRTLDLAFYSTTGAVCRVVRAGRRPARRAALRRHPAADARSRSARNLYAAGLAVRAAARRLVRLRVLPGHVDGDAARLGLRGAADAARHHQSGGDRGRHEAVRDRSRRRRPRRFVSASA